MRNVVCFHNKMPYQFILKDKYLKFYIKVEVSSNNLRLKCNRFSIIKANPRPNIKPFTTNLLQNVQNYTHTGMQ